MPVAPGPCGRLSSRGRVFPNAKRTRSGAGLPAGSLRLEAYASRRNRLLRKISEKAILRECKEGFTEADAGPFTGR
ncbi:hypothetical protein HMPREF9440_02141 [Sutterella parvirubra YIT 11816]|uniref:Uncharacterized protein n=1 Tax=Sutterella parvirubra YIT 11816 TaxID=762967 RepID=H3KH98_9BURK|nr:hypothetical protein HMPREF9440_02141 [Sutterella parvirubra YIT 11816]